MIIKENTNNNRANSSKRDEGLDYNRHDSSPPFQLPACLLNYVLLFSLGMFAGILNFGVISSSSPHWVNNSTYHK